MPGWLRGRRARRCLAALAVRLINAIGSSWREGMLQPDNQHAAARSAGNMLITRAINKQSANVSIRLQVVRSFGPIRAPALPQPVDVYLYLYVCICVYFSTPTFAYLYHGCQSLSLFPYLCLALR